MKKRIGLLALALITMVSMLGLTGCGSGDLNPYGDTSKYLKVGKYKGLEAEKISVTVEKSELADAINDALDAAKTTETLKDGDEIKDGDTVNINYVGKVDGKTFDGGSANKKDLVIGSGTFIDGFEEGLVGHTVGEKDIVLDLAFPLDYSTKNLQGKDVEFTVKINSATREVKPEYNVAFVKTQGDYKTTEEYEKAMKKSLYKQKLSEANTQQKQELWAKAAQNTEVKEYPKDMIEKYMECFDAQIDSYAEQNNTTRKTIISQYYGVSTEKELKKLFRVQAKQLVKQEMLIEYIADKEDLSYTDKEAETLQKNLEDQGYDEETVEKATGRNMDQYVHIELLYEKVTDFIQSKAIIK